MKNKERTANKTTIGDILKDEDITEAESYK